MIIFSREKGREGKRERERKTKLGAFTYVFRLI